MKLNSTQFKKRIPYWTEFIKAIWLHYFDKKIFYVITLDVDNNRRHLFVHSFYLSPESRLKDISIILFTDEQFKIQAQYFAGFIGSLNSRQLDTFFNTLIVSYKFSLSVLVDISPYLHSLIGDNRASLLDEKLSSETIDDLPF